MSDCDCDETCTFCRFMAALRDELRAEIEDQPPAACPGQARAGSPETDRRLP